jgi:hypothetical protein
VTPPFAALGAPGAPIVVVAGVVIVAVVAGSTTVAVVVVAGTAAVVRVVVWQPARAAIATAVTARGKWIFLMVSFLQV